jgi:hypothetical protein
VNPKVLITKLDEFNLLKQRREETVDEIEVSDFVTLMKTSFNIFSESVPGRPNFVRLTSSPYNASDPDCRSMQVPTHARGTKVCPLVILEVLRKFDIAIPDYNAAAAGQAILLPPRPKLVKSEKP